MGDTYNAPVYIGEKNDFSCNDSQINIYNGHNKVEVSYSVDNRKLNEIDMRKLSEELEVLKGELVKSEMYIEAENIKNAIKTNDESSIMSFLKAAGEKALNIAETTALPIAVDAIKKSIGL